MVDDGQANASVNISVVVRVRPLTLLEKKAGCTVSWEHAAGAIWQRSPVQLVRAVVPSNTYTFDHIFGAAASTRDIHRAVVESRVARLVHGYNATVLAYGQTSSGKTSTVRGMEGQEGLITLCMRQVLEMTAAQPDTPGCRRWGLRISYLEIYNETIADLLTGKTNLNVYEKKGGGVLIQDLSEACVSSVADAEELLRVGDDRRHTGSTAHNEKSSRAHTVFRLWLDCYAGTGEGLGAPAGEHLFTSELNLVDLAGSERTSAHARAPAGPGRDARQAEGAHINKSLLVLSTVILKLSDAAASRPGAQALAHVPYRSSKITRILQNSLGGNALSVIVCTVAPAAAQADETHNTLRFAQRARAVQTRPVPMQSESPAAMMSRYVAEIASLKLELAMARGQAVPPPVAPLDAPPAGGMLRADSASTVTTAAFSRDNSSTPSLCSLDMVHVEARSVASQTETAAVAIDVDRAGGAADSASGVLAPGAAAANGAAALEEASNCTALEEALARVSSLERVLAEQQRRGRQLETDKELLAGRVVIWRDRAEGAEKAAACTASHVLTARSLGGGVEGGTQSLSTGAAAVAGPAHEASAEMHPSGWSVEACGRTGVGTGESGVRSPRARGGSSSIDPEIRARLSAYALRLRAVERDKERLTHRLSLTLQEQGAGIGGAADRPKWRYKYMVELLRRSSLERRNEQLRGELHRLRSDPAAAPPSLTLPDIWEGLGDMAELAPHAATGFDRLKHLDLAGTL